MKKKKIFFFFLKFTLTIEQSTGVFMEFSLARDLGEGGQSRSKETRGLEETKDGGGLAGSHTQGSHPEIVFLNWRRQSFVVFAIISTVLIIVATILAATSGPIRYLHFMGAVAVLGL